MAPDDRQLQFAYPFIHPPRSLPGPPPGSPLNVEEQTKQRLEPHLLEWLLRAKAELRSCPPQEAPPPETSSPCGALSPRPLSPRPFQKGLLERRSRGVQKEGLRHRPPPTRSSGGRNVVSSQPSEVSSTGGAADEGEKPSAASLAKEGTRAVDAESARSPLRTPRRDGGPPCEVATTGLDGLGPEVEDSRGKEIGSPLKSHWQRNRPLPKRSEDCSSGSEASDRDDLYAAVPVFFSRDSFDSFSGFAGLGFSGAAKASGELSSADSEEGSSAAQRAPRSGLRCPPPKIVFSPAEAHEPGEELRAQADRPGSKARDAGGRVLSEGEGKRADDDGTGRGVGGLQQAVSLREERVGVRGDAQNPQSAERGRGGEGGFASCVVEEEKAALPFNLQRLSDVGAGEARALGGHAHGGALPFFVPPPYHYSVPAHSHQVRGNLFSNSAFLPVSPGPQGKPEKPAVSRITHATSAASDCKATTRKPPLQTLKRLPQQPVATAAADSPRSSSAWTVLDDPSLRNYALPKKDAAASAGSRGKPVVLRAALSPRERVEEGRALEGGSSGFGRSVYAEGKGTTRPGDFKGQTALSSAAPQTTGASGRAAADDPLPRLPTVETQSRFRCGPGGREEDAPSYAARGWRPPCREEVSAAERAKTGFCSSARSAFPKEQQKSSPLAEPPKGSPQNPSRWTGEKQHSNHYYSQRPADGGGPAQPHLLNRVGEGGFSERMQDAPFWGQWRSSVKAEGPGRDFPGSPAAPLEAFAAAPRPETAEDCHRQVTEWLVSLSSSQTPGEVASARAARLKRAAQRRGPCYGAEWFGSCSGL